MISISDCQRTPSTESQALHPPEPSRVVAAKTVFMRDARSTTAANCESAQSEQIAVGVLAEGFVAGWKPMRVLLRLDEADGCWLSDSIEVGSESNER